MEAGETVNLGEVNHFSSSLSNAVIGYDSTSKSTSLPNNASPAPTAILISGSEGGTESSASQEIPIPIFTSSQYSIQRRRTRSTPRSSRQEERQPPAADLTDTMTNANNMSKARIFSNDSGNLHSYINYFAISFQIYLKFRRRKSFCDWATSALLVLFKRPFSYDSETIRYSKYSNHRWNTNKIFKNKYNDWFKCMKCSHNCHNRICHLHDW